MKAVSLENQRPEQGYTCRNTLTFHQKRPGRMKEIVVDPVEPTKDRTTVIRNQGARGTVSIYASQAEEQVGAPSLRSSTKYAIEKPLATIAMVSNVCLSGVISWLA